MSSSAITIVISIAAINWFALEALWTRSKRKKGYKIYAAPLGLKCLYCVAVPAFIYGAVVTFFGNPNERWVSGLLFLIVFLAVYFFPATILLSEQVVISVQWFGIRKIQMKWNEVECVYSNPDDNTLVIQDKKQNRIIHTIYNIDRRGLIEQIYALPQNILSRITIRP